MRTFNCVSVVILALASANSVHAAPPSPISPGDIIFMGSALSWHKLNPTTGEITEITQWNQGIRTIGVTTIEFDFDGAILFESTDGIKRLNTFTGEQTSLNIPLSAGLNRGFVVESNGDLLLASSTGVSCYSRSTQTLTSLPVSRPIGLHPRNIARGDDGRVYVTDSVSDILEINLTTGSPTPVTSFDFSLPEFLAVQSTGDLVVDNTFPNVLYRVNGSTGAVELFTDDLPDFPRDIVVDHADNILVSSIEGIFKYPPTGGSGTFIGGDSLFLRTDAIAVVPQNWAPPVPEPTALAILCLGSVYLLQRRVAWLTSSGRFCKLERLA